MTPGGNLGTTMGFFLQWTGPNWFYGGWRSIEHEIVPSMDPALSLDLSWSDGTNRLQKHTQAEGFNPFVGTFSNNYEYSIEWTPDYVSLAINGQEY